ncbi:hypothetical protein ACFFLM_05835 [Deinococcus oregonensis]|uniref:Uncharacterized protein n=1 Tax=Deinococcus oregonensis TaxID=1805970 RepID=A0ABV6AVF9_9DEIO
MDQPLFLVETTHHPSGLVSTTRCITDPAPVAVSEFFDALLSSAGDLSSVAATGMSCTACTARSALLPSGSRTGGLGLGDWAAMLPLRLALERFAPTDDRVASDRR